MHEFIVARNPDRQGTLPFLVRFPIDGGLWFKVKDSWPRTARVSCHPATDVDIDAIAIVERVPVRACMRRGVAIDLVLDRGANRRSQFVTTTARGRRMVLWQTQKVATAARPVAREAAPELDLRPQPPPNEPPKPRRRRPPKRAAAANAPAVP